MTAISVCVFVIAFPEHVTVHRSTGLKKTDVGPYAATDGFHREFRLCGGLHCGRSACLKRFHFLQSTAATSERVFEFLAQEEMEDERDKKALLTDVKGNVEFRNVRFGYDADKIIIHDFSVNADAGQKIAIVGPTGAGKTTMVNLLMRFYDVQDGEILIDGTPIQSLPQGYDTMLGDNASISAGQRQLVTIARAMIQNAPMLILDEATSSVDTRTEVLIQKAMDKLMAQNGFYAELCNSQFEQAG